MTHHILTNQIQHHHYAYYLAFTKLKFSKTDRDLVTIFTPRDSSATNIWYSFIVLRFLRMDEIDIPEESDSLYVNEGDRKGIFMNIGTYISS